eukprot:m.282474 g.282474  ORF g.282474 m.282474 type:complete len:146 (-) comp19851_c0_seq1:326-763(-)
MHAALSLMKITLAPNLTSPGDSLNLQSVDWLNAVNLDSEVGLEMFPALTVTVVTQLLACRNTCCALRMMTCIRASYAFPVTMQLNMKCSWKCCLAMTDTRAAVGTVSLGCLRTDRDIPFHRQHMRGVWTRVPRGATFTRAVWPVR